MSDRNLDVRIIIKKYKSGEKLFKYEEEYLWKKLRDKADSVFSLYIRKRDSDREGHIVCVTSGVINCKGKLKRNEEGGLCNACHWIPRAWYSHRRDEKNVYAGCNSCNAFQQESHHNEFTAFLTRKNGIDRVEEQLRNKNKVKPRIDDLLEIIEKYTKKFNNLK